MPHIRLVVQCVVAVPPRLCNKRLALTHVSFAVSKGTAAQIVAGTSIAFFTLMAFNRYLPYAAMQCVLPFSAAVRAFAYTTPSLRRIAFFSNLTIFLFFYTALLLKENVVIGGVNGTSGITHRIYTLITSIHAACAGKEAFYSALVAVLLYALVGVPAVITFRKVAKRTSPLEAAAEEEEEKEAGGENLAHNSEEDAAADAAPLSPPPAGGFGREGGSHRAGGDDDAPAAAVALPTGGETPGDAAGPSRPQSGSSGVGRTTRGSVHPE